MELMLCRCGKEGRCRLPKAGLKVRPRVLSHRDRAASCSHKGHKGQGGRQGQGDAQSSRPVSGQAEGRDSNDYASGHPALHSLTLLWVEVDAVNEVEGQSYSDGTCMSYE